MTPHVTALFCSDVTVARFLRTPTGRGFAGDLLVECSSRPALSYVLNLEAPANYPGIAGILGGADVASLAHPAASLPAPIVLAAASPVAPAALRQALVQLRRPDERLRAITLLVPVADARALGAALAAADRFLIAWDVGANPHEELLDFAAWFAAEFTLTSENFAGLFPYAAESLEPAHVQRLRPLLTAAAAQAPAIRTDIVSASG